MSKSPFVMNELPPVLNEGELAMLDAVEAATVGHFRLLGFASQDIKPLVTGHRVIGTAVTLALPGWDSTLLHHVASDLRPGDILVIDRLGDRKVSCLGGGVSYALKAAGVNAVIVDGPCNDPYEIIDFGFPVWSRGVSPITTRLLGTGGAFNVPVCCGGAVVQPGDVVLADDSGVVFFPKDELADIASQALKLQELERQGLPMIGDGRTLGQLTGASKLVSEAMIEARE